MADSTINGLPALTGAATASGDKVAVWDADAATTKGQTIPEHASALAALGAGALSPTQQVFTSGSGTYTTPAGCSAIVVECVGGGGGGAGVAGNATQAAGSAGGQAGGYCRKFITSPAASYPYTVGAGGAGGAAGANNGSNGGTTTFGTSLLTANGGEGGYAMTSGTSVEVRFGQATLGTASGGDVNVRGQSGGPGIRGSASSCGSGFGGPGPWGGGGAVLDSSSGDGVAASGPGAGGGGACMRQNATNRAGGAGANGIIIVTEFYG